VGMNPTLLCSLNIVSMKISSIFFVLSCSDCNCVGL